MPELIQPTVYTINGIIYDEFDNPLSNVIVMLYDKDLRSEQFLGEKTTDARGNYIIEFNSRSAENPEYERVDIFIKVFDAAGILLGHSRIYFNVSGNTTINYKVGNTVYKGSSEFDALLQKIKPIVEPQQVPLGKLEENGQFQDISFLAGELSEDAKKISFINTAFNFFGQTKIAPDIFYALLRMAFPSELNLLLLIKPDSIKRALELAIAENIISEKWSRQLESVLKTFDASIARQVTEAGGESFKTIMGIALSEEQQKAFSETFYSTENEPDKLWEHLKVHPAFADNQVIKKTQDLLGVSIISGNQPELTKRLYKTLTDDPEIKQVSGFSKYDKDAWKENILSARVNKFPEWVKGTTPEEKTDNYAASLEHLHKQLYPTTFFASRLKADGGSAFESKSDLSVFFENNPEFDLKTNTIHKQLETSSFDLVQNIDAVKTDLKKLNRLSKLTDEYSVVNALHSKKISSATDIVSKYGEEEFSKEFSNVLGGEENGRKLYQKAISVSNKTAALLTSFRFRHDVKLFAIDGNAQAPAGYHEMFNDGELCECEHCQSVYSPAAYFVDMLAFIKKNNASAFKELLWRRPDLDDILLTCKNTNTPLPYIDLVNELLEKKVLKISDPGTTPDPEDQSYQTEGLPEELTATPEHALPSAYEPLKIVNKNSAFSAALPLHLPLEEIRIYSEMLGWNRYELLETLYDAKNIAAWDDVKRTTEFFKFSEDEVALINGVQTPDVAMPASGGVIDARVSTFLTVTKFAYPELLQLLESEFINPRTGNSRTIEITQTGTILTCDLDKLILSGADDAWLKKIVRFVRLFRKSGWDILDFDKTLKALQLTDFPATPQLFNERLLIPLLHIEKIRRLTKFALREVLAFFATIDTSAYINHAKADQPLIPSLYDSLFRNKSVAELANSPFTINGEGLAGSIAQHKEAISATLTVSLNDLDLIINENEPLSLDNLSLIYRTTLLARLLKTSINDLTEFISITDKKPINGVWPIERLNEFLKDWDSFKSTKIPVSQYRTILNQTNEAAYTLPIDLPLLESVDNTLLAIEATIADATLTNEIKSAQIKAHLLLFKKSITDNLPLMDALASTSLQKDDRIIKTAIERFSSEETELLLSGAISEVVEKVRNLKELLTDYHTWKFAPAILNLFEFSTNEIKWLKQNSVALRIAALFANPTSPNGFEVYHAFKRLFLFSKFKKIKSKSIVTWTYIFDILIANQPQSKNDFVNAFIGFLGVQMNAIIFLIGSAIDTTQKGSLNLDFPADFINPDILLNIEDACKIVSKLGGNDDQLSALLATAVTDTEAQAVKRLLKSKYNVKDWYTTIKPINDRLRARRRDGMLAWLISNPDSKFDAANAIYMSLLIDPEMEPCMVTSRIKQAISSVQLFIDRCLMNLEKDENQQSIFLGNNFSKQWNTWRKQYRVWEANRKVFLYPENWIEPELRDDKSPFFKELETQLKQNEVTDETAKEALQVYLSKLDAVANLEVMGLFNDAATSTLHVIGRTQNIPHQYYYRKQIATRWSAWEKVEVNIEGDNLLPVVYNGVFMLFWVEFIEKPVKGGGSTSITPGGGGSMNMDSSPAPKYYEVKLAWTQFKNGKWQSKKAFNENLSLEGSSQYMILEQHDYSLSHTIDQGNLFIRIAYPVDKAANSEWQFMAYVESFEYIGCNATIKIVNVPAIPFVKIPGTEVDGMMLKEKSDKLSLYESGPYSRFPANVKTIFNNTPGEFKILPERFEIEKERPVHFFYKNESTTFYAHSIEKRWPMLDNFSLVNAGIIMSRKPFSPMNVFAGATVSASSNGTIARRISHNFNDLINPDLLNSENHILEPIKILHGKKYRFQTFYHPFVCSYIKNINSKGIDELYKREVQQVPAKNIFNNTNYNPSGYVLTPYPEEELDFSYSGSYSTYNWELFFHLPLLIATRLSQNQKFEEARKWFHYIFDPTVSNENNAGPERFWITKPFRKEIIDGVLSLEELLHLEENANDLASQLNNWENNPFNPHAVARLRISAYMRTTVIKYINNLIAWGDQLFRRDTIESINEATLIYILASNILGKRPDIVPPRGRSEALSFSTIEEKLDQFSNTLTEVESFISPSADGDSVEQIRMSYFGLPKNDTLLKYWDTINDRLFKIRRCQNIEGTFRTLSLFESPIDPALLVKATEAGVDLDTVLGDLNIVLPHYRFQVMLQKANELCDDVKTLGNSVLSLLEKRDAEALALLRSTQEIKMLELLRDIKEKQRNEAIENLNGLTALRTAVEEKSNFYNSRDLMNTWEALYLQSSYIGLALQTSSAEAKLLAAILHKIPDVKVGAPTSAGMTTGGSTIGAGAETAADGLSTIGFINSAIGLIANTMGGYNRRMDDWKFQAKSADLELKQVDKQILAAEIRLAIAEKELENHEQQMDHSKEVDDFMHRKFTNEDLYDWMIEQASMAYFQSYQLAYNTAKKAEKCMQYELGTKNGTYIQPDSWDSLRKGLLCGEKLQHNLRRLELSYLDDNKRELEITKHISLVQLDPIQILNLRMSGECTIKLPEEIFDLDFPGHYFRRIKTVSLSIPCVAGPYTSVNATLTLRNNKYRAENNSGDYGPSDDEKTNWQSGRFRSIVNRATAIATSSGQNDAGVFELNFRDDRYLPFEGSGVISEWALELNKDFRQFDYNTISDIIIHLRYTAREETSIPDIKPKVNAHLKKFFENAVGDEQGLSTRVISLKHEFPSAFYQLINTNPQKTLLDISNNHFSWLFATKNIQVAALEAFLIPKIGKVISVDPAEFKIKSILANSWGNASFSPTVRTASFNINDFDPRTQIKVEAGTGNGNDGLNKEEIDDILISLRFTIL